MSDLYHQFTGEFHKTMDPILIILILTITMGFNAKMV